MVRLLPPLRVSYDELVKSNVSRLEPVKKIGLSLVCLNSVSTKQVIHDRRTSCSRLQNILTTLWMLTGRPLLNTSSTRASEWTILQRIAFNWRTSESCNEISIEAFFKHVISNIFNAIWEFVARSFSKKLTPPTYVDICPSCVFGRLSVVASFCEKPIKLLSGTLIYFSQSLAQSIDPCLQALHSSQTHSRLALEKVFPRSGFCLQACDFS